jgi:hypothetical protein
MATFTIALKYALEITGATPENAYASIGLGDYPIFDPDYRDVLNQKIVERYFNREIGMETIDMFQFALRRKMNEIMPYYNKLYCTEKLNYDPLSTMDITTKANSTNVEDATAEALNNSTSNTDSGSRSVQSTTPQTMLSGLEDYASSAADVTSDSDVSSESIQDSTANTTTTADAESHVYGYQGIPANLIMAYRASLLNIDLMILADIEECFMLVWDNGDEYSQSAYLYPRPMLNY